MSDSARVISASRRNAHLITQSGDEIVARLGTGLDDVVAGDLVLFSDEDGLFIIREVVERTNCLKRTYRKRTKLVAANLDRLFIVSAIGSLINTVFIDRVSAVALLEDIPFTLLVNKIDLGIEQNKELLAVYESLDIPLLYLSAKGGEGVSELVHEIMDPEIQIVALAGVSGVGKSTILNTLIPEARRETKEVSEKTGQGRQTTSLAMGYRFSRKEMNDLLIIDLPGIQSFGVSAYTPRQILEGFSEIHSIGLGCEYTDCAHLAEPNCEVKRAIEDGRIAVTRYNSYVNMLEEIERAREY